MLHPRFSVIVALAVTAALIYATGRLEAAEETGFDPLVVDELSAPHSVAIIDDRTGEAPTSKLYSFRIPSGYCNPQRYEPHARANDCDEQSVRSQVRENVFATKKNGNGQPKQSWYGFAVYLPQDFPYGVRQADGYMQLFYFHNKQCQHISLANFAGKDDSLYLAFSNALGNYSCTPGPRLKVADFKNLVGKWSRFELFIKWANDSSGRVKIYLDGKLVTEWRGPTFTPGLERINYAKFGIYLCCTQSVAQVRSASLYFAAVRRAETRDGLYTQGDAVALKSLQVTLNALGCEVGKPDGHPSERIREMALSCRKFPADVAPRDLSAATVRSFLALYSDPAAAVLERGTFVEPPPEVAPVSNVPNDVASPSGLLVPVFKVHAYEGQTQKGGSNSTYVTDLDVKIDKSGGTPNFSLAVVVHSNVPENIDRLEMFLNAPTRSAGKIAACAVGSIKYPDGTDHVAFKFDKSGDTWMVDNASCLIAALPKNEAAVVRFVAEHFSDIAVGMVADGSVNLLTFDVMRNLVSRVATGELKIAGR
ncbi:heparin lyase I family protein [Mesorhizobium sp. WSM3859]|uniref:heparin lyase I family protein n=1 Tax=Mesorhizobium sp. WSM3859 TaxID=2029402 RepID=UPI000BC9E14A|nr:heparin lyase I family protein [Mesorhizobium sp. WSM3859]PBC06764.1 hypothetical protein CK230_30320 [Mesorhizobium sp. WSM3859]